MRGEVGKVIGLDGKPISEAEYSSFNRHYDVGDEGLDEQDRIALNHMLFDPSRLSLPGDSYDDLVDDAMSEHLHLIGEEGDFYGDFNQFF